MFINYVIIFHIFAFIKEFLGNLKSLINLIRICNFLTSFVQMHYFVKTRIDLTNITYLFVYRCSSLRFFTNIKCNHVSNRASCVYRRQWRDRASGARIS